MLQRFARSSGLQRLCSGLLGSQDTVAQKSTSVVLPSCQGQGLTCLADWWVGFLHLRHNSTNAGLKVYKPTTPGLRGRIVTTREDLWAGRPYRPLTMGLRKSGGRNNQGRTTVWHRGGGSKRLYRFIDFSRRHEGEVGTVERLEYDPNRTARIALVKYPEGSAAGVKNGFTYVLAPQGVKPGDSITSGPTSAIHPGNTLPLSAMPIGQQIHNVELRPGKGGQMARSAGTSATLIARGADGYATVRLPSGEQRRVLAACRATVGALSNPQHKNRKLGKAGAARWSGRRPTTRGMAMNPVDHPHGGGRGKRKGRISQTPWGKPTKGYKTRKSRNPTDVFIHLSRHAAKKAR
ncbi:ribosomal protein L2 [Coccomyxa subellipsoidea C-169]|uniref:Large ribosomal subunit protein uL2m n=1 Tax=Coccomyxa subellipsoidea (strain C-169) TaxID=574566 RepID=I0YQJ8_COCSC|nr:ribosomal protein L2 [Coccomyxa subellipsoidea C-169]EIE20667.1 ribosomal protein L2 [Coccomyxa subellipsoidea C-169]|eukprot:XP_005645211.1 ribosomal protein L2 [Coccomyxa subellipsoidea C-169]